MNTHHCPALLVSAPASGQGKTSVTAALARWHARQGRRVRVFKTGPDFLDPMVLERASGAPVYQLDLWMNGEADVRARLHAAASEADLILVEGVMGLFDGAPSSADLAVRFDLPVLAVIDGSAMAQTFGALALGLARYRDDLRVHGVAANRVGSDYHASLLAQSLPVGLRWMGALPRDPALAMPERHLGLVPADEVGSVDRTLDALADAWARHASTELPPAVAFAPWTGATAEAASVAGALAGVRIAIARDDAFCFLYPANLELLREAGAELRFFSPLAGEPLPPADAAWLPGGYPELHLDALSANVDLHAALRAHRDAGKPLLAECGGLLFGLDALADREGDMRPMAGLLAGSARLQPRLAGLGLQQVTLPEGTLRGHTFHYAQADIAAPALATATNPNGGPSREAVYRDRRLTASFVHFYFPSNPAAAVRLLRP
ncbi:cobyrinate a,c-diamide synthase [Aerolutibacter ruishenii]|uniref:Cobyrinate a,c-diamide synthase n=1 Tax=Aerolutibacter ruishenii TaxID=686800 RepID=A0A562M2I3_9GAMM|nr:cobyrinate a,c-diamide synthase [Lysobacter ruishenii]TWI14144.1 hydrogenobyrinic acid a,c-diamide synthase (glutamine-hydrolysing) /cobyrinate a,c-diamide synthase [Lysobacter ruishenii]